MRFNKPLSVKAFFQVSLFTLFVLCVCASSVKSTALAPFIDLQEQGLTVASNGVGLQGFSGTTRQIQVNVGGNVRFALLYWAGRETPCEFNGATCTFSQPYKDQQMIFNGTPITGTVIGTETSAGPTLNIGYFADVTSIVSAAGTGLKTFNIQDGNTASNLSTLDGMSLVVAYTNAADSDFYRVLVWDNLDFAFAGDPTVEAQQTTAVNFNHGSISGARFGQLTIIAGNGTSAGTDSITVSNNTTILNSLNASSGALWDNDIFSINIPGGVSTTTVQVNSSGAAPDSILWQAAMLRVGLVAPTAASVSVSGRVTTASGRGIRNVQITLTDANGNTRTAQTTTFGYYSFDDVAAGETVTLSAKARQFRFAQSTIVRTTNDSISDADFVSVP